MKNGLPPAPLISLSSRAEGGASTASATRAATASSPSGPSASRPARSPVSTSSSRCSCGVRGAGRRHPIRATGRWVRRRLQAPRVIRLEGSAHWRSSIPITTGPRMASVSTRSTKASTTRNCSPGSLVTVTGPPSELTCELRSRPTFASSGSADDSRQPRASATTPNGRVRSSSSPRADDPDVAGPGSVERKVEQPRLPDARLALDQQHRASARGDLVECLGDHAELVVAAMQRSDGDGPGHVRDATRHGRSHRGSRGRAGIGGAAGRTDEVVEDAEQTGASPRTRLHVHLCQASAARPGGR